MRKTLIGLAALSIAALVSPSCDKEQQTGTEPGLDLSMGSSDPDLSTPTSGEDMASSTADLAGTSGPPRELVVLRIGTGTATLTNDATAGFLERRLIADGSLVGTALALPVAANGANKQITFSGLATVEGQLNLSADGKYLIVAGYAANPGVNNISSSASATYNRVIARIDASNNINTATATSGFTGTAVRGATSTDGTNLWISTDSGIGYTTLNSTALPTVLNTIVSRAIAIFGGGNGGRQLYVSSVSSSGASSMGVNTVGTGTPMAAGVTTTRLTGFTDTNSPAAVGFVAFDRDNNGAIDQMYVADDRVAGGGGVQRWKLNGTSWMLEGTISMGASAGARYLTGYVAGNGAMVFATTAEAGTTPARLMQITDTGGATSAATTKLLATAGNNTTYRGIAFPPVP